MAADSLTASSPARPILIYTMKINLCSFFIFFPSSRLVLKTNSFGIFILSSPGLNLSHDSIPFYRQERMRIWEQTNPNRNFKTGKIPLS